MEAKTFSPATAKTAASKERPSDRQLRTQQLGGTELPPSSFGLSSLKEETFDNSSFQSKALQKSLAQESFQRTTFKKSFAQKSFHQHTFYKNSFDESSLEDSSFNQRSFEESSFDQSSLDESSLKTSSFEQSSLEPNSFEHSSFEASNFRDSSFPEDSLATATSLADRSFKRPALPTELAQLERTPFTTELAQLTPTALHTELAQLEEPASTKAASSLELRTAHSSFRRGALPTLCGGKLETASPQGRVVKAKPPLPSLTLDQLELWQLPWLKTCLELLDKGSFCPLQLSSPGIRPISQTLMGLGDVRETMLSGTRASSASIGSLECTNIENTHACMRSFQITTRLAQKECDRMTFCASSEYFPRLPVSAMGSLQSSHYCWSGLLCFPGSCCLTRSGFNFGGKVARWQKLASGLTSL